MATLVVLLAPMDLLWNGFQNKGVNLCVYVDDIALHVVSQLSAVATVVSRTTPTVVESLEGDLAMEVPRRGQGATEVPGKTDVAVIDPEIRASIATTMRRLGIKVRAKSVHMGGLFSGHGQGPPHGK